MHHHGCDNHGGVCERQTSKQTGRQADRDTINRRPNQLVPCHTHRYTVPLSAPMDTYLAMPVSVCRWWHCIVPNDSLKPCCARQRNAIPTRLYAGQRSTAWRGPSFFLLSVAVVGLVAVVVVVFVRRPVLVVVTPPRPPPPPGFGLVKRARPAMAIAMCSRRAS